MTRFYECVIAVEAALPAAAFSSLASGVETELRSAGAQDVVFADWGKRRLACKLKKLELIQCLHVGFKASGAEVLESLRRMVVFDSRIKR